MEYSVIFYICKKTLFIALLFVFKSKLCKQRFGISDYFVSLKLLLLPSRFCALNFLFILPVPIPKTLWLICFKFKRYEHEKNEIHFFDT